jgi:arylsulfatase A-like enzyme
MVSAVDAMLTNLTVAMKAKGMWEDTLVFFLGDNGGPSR